MNVKMNAKDVAARAIIDDMMEDMSKDRLCLHGMPSDLIVPACIYCAELERAGRLDPLFIYEPTGECFKTFGDIMKVLPGDTSMDDFWIGWEIVRQPT